MTKVGSWQAEEEIYSILERESSQVCSTTTLAAILKSEGHRIVDQLLLIGTKASETKQTTNSNDTNIAFTSALSNLLHVESCKIALYVDYYMLHQLRIDAVESKLNYCSLLALESIRDFINSRIRLSWKIMHKLSLIASIADHIYHDVVLQFLGSLPNTRPFCTEMVEYFVQTCRTLASTHPDQILDPSYRSNPLDMAQFNSDNKITMLKLQLELLQYTASVLVLGNIETWQVTPQQVKQLLQIMIATTPKIPTEFLKSIAFSRLSCLVISISSIVCCDSNGVDDQVLFLPVFESVLQYTEPVPLLAVLALMGGIFLNKSDNEDCRRCSRTLLKAALLEVDSMSLFLNLLENFSSPYSTEGGWDAVQMFEKLQDFVNSIVSFLYVDNSAKSLENIEIIVRLIQLTYRNDEHLCQVVWDKWISGKQLGLASMSADSTGDMQILFRKWHPLCRFLCFLRDYTSHDSKYLYEVLSCLVCSAASAKMVMNILDSTVVLSSFARVANLRSLGSGRYVEFIGESRKSRILSPSIRLLHCSGPWYGLQGQIIGFVDEGVTAVVQWDARVALVDCFLDSLMEFSNSGDDCLLLQSIECADAALQLLGHLSKNAFAQTWTYLEGHLTRSVCTTVLAELHLAHSEIGAIIQESSIRFSWSKFQQSPEQYFIRFLQSEGCNLDSSAMMQYRDIVQKMVEISVTFPHVVDSFNHVLATIVSISAGLAMGLQWDCSRQLTRMATNSIELSRALLENVSGMSNISIQSAINGAENIIEICRGSFLSNPKLAVDFGTAALHYCKSLLQFMELHGHENGLFQLMQGSSGMNAIQLGAALASRGFDLAQMNVESLVMFINPVERRCSYDDLIKFSLSTLDPSSAEFASLQHCFRVLALENVYIRSDQRNRILENIVNFCCEALCWCTPMAAAGWEHTQQLTSCCLDIIVVLFHRLPGTNFAENEFTSQLFPFQFGVELFLSILSVNPTIAGKLFEFGTFFAANSLLQHATCSRKYSTSTESRTKLGKTGVPMLNKESDIPISWCSALIAMPQEQMERIKYIGAKSLRVVNSLIDASCCRHRAALKALLETVLMPCSSLSIYSGLTVAASETTCAPNYYTLLAGMFNIPNLTIHLPTDKPSLDIAAVICLQKVLMQFNNLCSKSWVDSIGLENIAGICKSMCLLLSSSLTNGDFKTVVIEFLVSLIKCHAAAFALMLSVPIEKEDETTTAQATDKVSTVVADTISVMHDAAPKESALTSCISSLLKSASELYVSNPLLLHKLLELVIAMFEACNNHTIALTVAHIIATDCFWDKVSCPLMENLTTKSLDLLRKDSQETTKHCHLLLTHASSLRLLTMERYGILFDIFGDTCVSHCKRVDEMLSRAMNANRFLFWVKHYLRTSYSEEFIIQNIKICAKEGFVASLLARRVPDISDTTADVDSQTHFGDGYSYDITAIATLSNKESGPFSNPTTDQLTQNLLNVCDSLRQMNCQLSICDAELYLLQCFGKFLEVYISPSRPRVGTFSKRTVSIDINSTLTPRKSSGESNICLSPNVGPSTSLSSPALRSSSEFSGDKRSYEVITTLRSDLGSEFSSTTRDNALSASELRLLGEKLRILTNMLHHQLKDITLRTSDPSQSRVESRYLMNPRLDTTHIMQLLKILVRIGTLVAHAQGERYSSKTELAESSKSLSYKHHDVHLQSVRIWLSGSVLLLLEGIRENELIGEGEPLLFDSVDLFESAAKSLENEITRNESNLLSSTEAAPTHAADADGYLTPTSASQNPFLLAQLSVEIMILCLPSSSRYLTPTQSAQWTRVFQDTTILSAVIAKFKLISAAMAPFAQIESNLLAWQDDFHVGEKGKLMVSGSFNKIKTHSTSPTTVAMLSGLIDIFLCKFFYSQQNIAFFDAGINLAEEIIKSPLFLEFQRILCAASVTRSASGVAVLMGYSSIDGDLSSICQCWQRAIMFFVTFLKFYASTSIENNKLRLFSCCESLLSNFGNLLCIPLSPGNIRMSLEQLRLSNLSISLFGEISRYIPAWRSILSIESVDAVTSNIAALVGKFSCIVPAASQSIYFGFSSKLQPDASRGSGGIEIISKALRETIVMISNDEKLGIRDTTVPRKRKSKLSSGLSKKSSSTFTTNESTSKLSISENDVDPSAGECSFYQQFEREIVNIFLVSLMFLTQTQTRYESIAEFEAKHKKRWTLSNGLTVIARIQHADGRTELMEGTISGIHGDGTVDFLPAGQSLAALRPLVLHAYSILFTKSPAIQFESFFGPVGKQQSGGSSSASALPMIEVALNEHASQDATNMPFGSDYISTYILPELSSQVASCHTAHLLRILCYSVDAETHTRLMNNSGELMSSLQTVAEICVSTLLLHLQPNMKDAATLENLELVLRALQQLTSVKSQPKSPTVEVPSPMASGTNHGSFLQNSDWIEFAEVIVSHLIQIDVVNRVNETKRSPEKTPAKKGGRRALEYVFNPATKEELF